ncbi:MAG: BPL-N domain-containing protein [Candidatus Thorarchaeota archaeon]
METQIVVVMLLVSSIILPGIPQVNENHSNFELADDLSGVHVAIFNATVTDISSACKNATKAMYEWMNATVEFVDENDVLENRLYGYDIFVIPPGNLPEYSVKLGSDGKEKIREYIRNGGSFVGVSRGAHFACEIANVYSTVNNWGLNLFNGTGLGPVDGYLDPHMYVANINKTLSGFDFSSLPDSMTMMGWESIRFIPENNVPLNVIASYSTNNQPAMISYGYGQGTVFLSGIHPEFEEDADRDNTAYFDQNEDPETDWPLMLAVSGWQLETSTWDNASIDSITATTTGTATSTTNDTDTTDTTLAQFPVEILAIAGGLGIVVILIAAVALLRKRG